MKHFWRKLTARLFACDMQHYQLEIGALTARGLQRDNNQDDIGFILSENQTSLLAVVADGMGGHQGGEVASRMAVELLLKDQYEMNQRKLNANRLKQQLKTVNHAIYERAQSAAELQGMGTTLVVLSIAEGRAVFGHVGDSRLYRFRAGDCQQLTQDHSLVAEMVRDGLITQNMADSHPDKNIITRAIGTQPEVEVDSIDQALTLKVGDCFLLCSDGLHDLVSPLEMLVIVSGNSAQKACECCVQLANDRGGHDNISVIIIKVLKKTKADSI